MHLFIEGWSNILCILGAILVTAGEDNQVKVWELVSLKCLRTVLLPGVSGVNNVVIKVVTLRKEYIYIYIYRNRALPAPFLSGMTM